MANNTDRDINRFGLLINAASFAAAFIFFFGGSLFGLDEPLERFLIGGTASYLTHAALHCAKNVLDKIAGIDNWTPDTVSGPSLIAFLIVFLFAGIFFGVDDAALRFTLGGTAAIAYFFASKLPKPLSSPARDEKPTEETERKAAAND